MVDSVTNLINTSSVKNTRTSKSTLGKDDFLKLMISQLKNQDPLSPMDGTQYAAQLAQFSSLEQLTNLNDAVKLSMETNSQLTQAINNTMMATLIGKDVKLDGNKLILSGQENITLGYNLPVEAKNVQLKIYNANGALVKTMNVDSSKIGDNKLSWDLTDNSGNKLTNGNYTFAVEATNLNGEAMTVSLFKYGTIDGVKFTNDKGTVILINGAQYSISDISEVLNPNNKGDGK